MDSDGRNARRGTSPANGGYRESIMSKSGKPGVSRNHGLSDRHHTGCPRLIVNVVV
jgi:hypothetical protein